MMVFFVYFKISCPLGRRGNLHFVIYTLFYHFFLHPESGQKWLG